MLFSITKNRLKMKKRKVIEAKTVKVSKECLWFKNYQISLFNFLDPFSTSIRLSVLSFLYSCCSCDFQINSSHDFYISFKNRGKL